MPWVKRQWQSWLALDWIERIFTLIGYTVGYTLLLFTAFVVVNLILNIASNGALGIGPGAGDGCSWDGLGQECFND